MFFFQPDYKVGGVTRQDAVIEAARLCELIVMQ